MRRVGSTVSLLALSVAAVMTTVGAQAGQEPYIAVVGDDYTANDFYISYKHQQFLHTNTDFLAYCATGGQGDASYTRIACPSGQKPVEYFKVNNVFWHNYGAKRPEVCWGGPQAVSSESGSSPEVENYGNENGLITAGNAGSFEWRVVLPKKPVSNINLVLQCGVLKPDSFALLGYDAIWLCAGETGETVGAGLCVRAFIPDGRNPITPSLQPKLSVTATAGPYSPTPGASFTMTAFRVPGTFVQSAANQAAHVLLTPTTASNHVHLKACMSESIIIKMPVRNYDVDGNGPGTVKEFDLTQGDYLTVNLRLLAGHTMDMYCNWESLKVEGMGEPETLLP